MNNEIKMIPIDRIRVLNPRPRDKKKFELIVQSIKNLGLKKPIQVSLRSADEGTEPGYDLVCGQGRIEAVVAHGIGPASAHGNGATYSGLLIKTSDQCRRLRLLMRKPRKILSSGAHENGASTLEVTLLGKGKLIFAGWLPFYERRWLHSD